MKKANLLLITLLFVIICKCYAQNEDIYQKWFFKEHTNCIDSVKNTKLSDQWSIEFKRNQKAEIILSTPEMKSIQNFKLDSNQITLDYMKFTIEKISRDTLIIIEQLNNNCNKNIMISTNQIFYNQKQRYLISNLDTVYFPVYGNCPKLEHSDNYKDYFINEFLKGVLEEHRECSIKYQFIVSKNGDILEPKVWDSCNGRYEKLMLKIINRTKKKWVPMYLYEKPVNTLIIIKFKYV